MIQVTKVKKVFHNAGIQVSTDAINLIRSDIERQVRLMAKRCERGNVKRLTSDTYHIAMGNLKQYFEK